MKQVLLGKCIVVADVPAPGLGAREVLVETAYSFISTGTETTGVKSAGSGLLAKIKEHPERVARVLDMVRVNGIRKTLALVRAKIDARNPLGYSCAGRVIAAGRDVQHLAVGDLVACGGQGYASHAEVVAVPMLLTAKVPDGCDLRQASGATVAAIALQGVRRAGVQLGETAAVVGLGLLGQISLQILRAMGVRALGFDPNSQRVAEARALGFDQCFAATGADAVDEVNNRTAGMGADATLITAASSVPGICQDAMEMTRRKGRVVVVGAVPLQFDRDPFYRKELDFLISCSYGPGRYDGAYEEGGQDYPYGYVRWTENRNLQAVMAMMATGTLRLDGLIAAEYPVARAEEAFAALTAEGGPRPLAVVLQYDLAPGGESPKTATRTQVYHARPLTGRIGLGIIGVGQFCQSTHLPNLAILRDRYQVVAVCDKTTAKAQDVARQHGAALVCANAEELIADPNVQAVIITTRHDIHAPLAIQALRAGKCVFTEKPMAMNTDQLAQLKEAIGPGGPYFMVGFNRRFSPQMVRLADLLRRRVSPVVVTYRVIADPAPAGSWIYTSAGGGRVIGEACHMLDVFNLLVGDDVATVELDTMAPPPGKAGPPGDNFVATLRYADGSVCTLTYSTLGRKSKENGKERIEAMWDGKTFVIDDFVHCFGAGCSAGSAGGHKGKGHYEELVALADHLAGKAPAPIGLDACVRATEQSFLIDAVCRGRDSEERPS